MWKFISIYQKKKQEKQNQKQKCSAYDFVKIIEPSKLLLLSIFSLWNSNAVSSCDAPLCIRNTVQKRTWDKNRVLYV